MFKFKLYGAFHFDGIFTQKNSSKNCETFILTKNWKLRIREFLSIIKLHFNDSLFFTLKKLSETLFTFFKITLDFLPYPKVYVPIQYSFRLIQ